MHPKDIPDIALKLCNGFVRELIGQESVLSRLKRVGVQVQVDPGYIQPLASLSVVRSVYCSLYPTALLGRISSWGEYQVGKNIKLGRK